jgi:hypothetical protein
MRANIQNVTCIKGIKQVAHRFTINMMIRRHPTPHLTFNFSALFSGKLALKHYLSLKMERLGMAFGLFSNIFFIQRMASSTNKSQLHWFILRKFLMSKILNFSLMPVPSLILAIK